MKKLLANNMPAEQRAKARALATAALDSMSAEEDAALTAAALADPDNLPLDAAPLSGGVTFAGHIAERQRRRGERGPQKAPKLEAVTLRLPTEVLLHYRSTGKGWQRRMREDLNALVGKKA